MRIGWISFHVEGILALQALLEKGVHIEAVITLKPKLSTKRSGAADYATLCTEFQIPFYQVENINDEESIQLLRKLSLDLVFVIGWSQIVRPEVLRLAKVGMIGAHASFLPHNRGGAPINWALIKGEKQTGNSLIWLAESLDGGDLIEQTVIPITPYDTCASLYERVAESNRDMILRTLPRLLAGERIGCPQSHTDEHLLPRRRPKDGLIDWTKDSQSIYDFVRALTRPYPGAFSWLADKRWFVWQAALLPINGFQDKKNGEIIGPVLSPQEAACGQAVACGKGVVVLLEIQAEDEDQPLLGRRLSDHLWTGKVWTNE